MATINPVKVDVHFDKLEKIIQIADIHIRLFKRHKEYKEVFEQLYEDLKFKGQLFENSVIVVCGDILHAKTDLSPEMIALASEFLKKLADISPTLVIVGNHDMNLANSFRLDSLSPIIENISHPDLYYLKDNGIYTVADTEFAVYSIIGDRRDWPRLKKCKSPNKIALCHSPVNTATTDTGFTITSRHVDLSLFNGYDMVLLGDIHRHQVLQEYDAANKKPIVAYAGSMIQQNHGERLEGHGWLEWDVKNRSFEFHEVKNDYGYATLIIENGKLPNLDHIPPKARLRVFVKDLEASKVKKIESILKKKFDLKEFIVNKMRDSSVTLDNQKHASDFIDVHDIENQNKLIEDYLTRHHALVDDTLMTRIFEINKELNAKVGGEDLSRNIHWKPLLFEFSNMFSYGDDNVLNFESMRGVHGLFSPNASGKTAAFDALMFCLYDKTPRAFKASHIINNRKNKFRCYLKFEINGVEYGIKRIGIRKKNQDVKVDVDFWHTDENGNKISLNAEDRRHTNAVIRRYVGNYEDFILTSLSLQNNNALFIDKSQSERKDLLSQFMGINIFDLLYQLALDEMKEATGALKMLSKGEGTQALVAAQEEIDVLQEEYKIAETERGEKEAELNEVVTSITNFYEAKVPLDLNSFDITKLEETKAELVTSLTSLSETVGTLVRRVEDLRAQSGSLAEAVKTYTDMDISDSYEEMVSNEKKLKELESELKMVQSQIESVQSQIDHMVTHEFDPECEFCVKNNQKMVQTTNQLKKSLVEYKRARSSLTPYIDDLRSLMQDYDDVVEDYQVFISTSKELAEVDRNLWSSKAHLSDSKSRVTSKKAKLKEADSNIKKYYESVDLIEKNAEIDEKIGNLEQKQNELENEIKLREAKIRGLHGKLQVQKANKTKILKQIAEMEELEQTIHAYQYYVDAVKRNGVPYEIISKVIPSIESEVNNILSQIADFTIGLEVDGKNINGRISYGDNRHWPLEMSSGMERFISSLAIRVALITVSNLPKPNFLIIDEGLGVLSSENLMSMHMLFSILKNQFDFIIIISHLEAVRDMVDSLMEIQLDNGYSKLNY